ncbi:PTS sugar transporter subunit IIC [Levilactobacillus acidifarinae]|uniref:Mannose-specific PTS system component IIC n=1 Tax=Levilactobacillus acidifarinae DSM 19394 = JCM 15949 TaxID=1423715 RepID=A0A0R1LXP6_9LACO|nr:PTS sugar transporter subunit IIC [Levilactobacillus acidifarinae]KRK96503.1 mannose-specific PTS system component IIC [Levilactobacillus acidifarinae DSM 19394]GEO68911.1 PTS mannose/fructose/sorbose transporter subunit IIC [Levilactobacillus acidifarinae]
MNISTLAVLIIAFLAGIGGVVDEWEVHQPIIACTLVGLALGHPLVGVTLGASLQLITLGWMNIGTVVGPDPALAAVVTAWWVAGPAQLPVALGVILALPLAWVGQWITRGMRQVVVPVVNRADRAAAAGDLHRITRLQLLCTGLQGLRTLLPAALLMVVPASWLQTGYQALPTGLQGGFRVAAGMLVVVSFALVINTMATHQLWPFFFLGFALATDQHLSLIALGMIGVGLAVLYLGWHGNSGSGSTSGGATPPSTTDDDLDRELDDL